MIKGTIGYDRDIRRYVIYHFPPEDSHLLGVG